MEEDIIPPNAAGGAILYPMTCTARRRSGWTLLVVVLTASLSATGRQAPPAAPAGASIDFLALSADGLPVADLEAADVSLKVDGRARPIRALRFVPIADGSGATPGTDPSVPPPFGSNAPDTSAARAMVLVIDDDSFRVGTERALREAAEPFLAGLSPADRLALVTMPYGGTRVSFTTDRAPIKAALAQIIGQAPSNESLSDVVARSRRTLESLTGLLAGLAGGPPPIILFFSAGLAGPGSNTLGAGPGIGTPQTLGSELQRETFQRVGQAAAVVGARIYLIQPTDASSRLDGLESLAGVTGASMMHLGGSDSNALSRVARETAAHYVADFDVEPAMRNGASHRVELRLSRPGVSVRVRPSLVLAKSGKSISPRDMLRQATVYTDLPVRVAGFASREPAGTNVRIVVVSELGDGSTKVAAAVAALFDAGGRLITQWTANAEDLARSPMVGALTVPPGQYRLRLAATDIDGRAGTADTDVAAELTSAGPLQLSALVLGVSRGGFAPRLQFGKEPVALAHVEIYGGKTGLPVTATFEVSRTLNGPALVTVPGALGAAAGHHAASGAIPVGGLPPGDYVVRATVRVEGQPAGRAVRTLRKVVPDR